MADTHPNAYLMEAQAKREQANTLLAEAESLEEQARALQGEPTTDEIVADVALEEDRPEKQYDEEDPHRHDRSKKK